MLDLLGVTPPLPAGGLVGVGDGRQARDRYEVCRPDRRHRSCAPGASESLPCSKYAAVIARSSMRRFSRAPVIRQPLVSRHENPLNSPGRDTTGTPITA